MWASAAANMRTYLLLKERAAAFRADPEVQEALAAARVAELATPTLAAGESLPRPARRPHRVRGLRRRTSSARKGFGFVRLNQLAVEHLLGAR